MVSDRAKDGNREFGPRAGGTREMSRWCNHRTTPTNHEPRPERAREGHAGSGGQHRQETFERFSRPCRAHPVSGMLGRPSSGGSRSLRDLHHRLISFEPPARKGVWSASQEAITSSVPDKEWLRPKRFIRDVIPKGSSSRRLKFKTFPSPFQLSDTPFGYITHPWTGLDQVL